MATAAQLNVTSVSDRLNGVQETIARACRRVGRAVEEVTLVAVSKTHPAELLTEAARAGQRVFGENRVQEFAGKLAAIEAAGFRVETHAADASTLNVHLIGQLQSNKSTRAAELFSSIDTLDGLRLAERLDRAAREQARVVPVLVEIKTSDEPTKTGLLPGSDELSALLERFGDLEGLRLRGLMTVAPFDVNPEAARTAFRQLRELRDGLARSYRRLSFDTLSMGMSGDLEVAIEEGSTEVRVGTAIFGARPKREEKA